MNSIYAYFDSFGSLKERISQPIRTNATARIYAYCESYETAESFTSATIRFVLKTAQGTQWIESFPTSGQGLELIPTNYTANKDLRWFDPTKQYYFVWFDIPQDVIQIPATWRAVVTYRHAISASQTDSDPMSVLTFEVEGDPLSVEVTESITLDQYNYLLSQIPTEGGDAEYDQTSAVLIRGPITNINGQEPTDIKTIVHPNESATGLQVVYASNDQKITEERAVSYMNDMTGSNFLPLAGSFTKRSYFLDVTDGQLYEPLWDDTYGLSLYEVKQLVLESQVEQTLSDNIRSIPSSHAVTTAISQAVESNLNYYSLDLNADQRNAIETSGQALINIHQRWNGELAIYFWDEFAIYLKNGETEDGDPIFEGDIPTDNPNTYEWEGHLRIVWTGSVLDIRKEPPWHEPLTNSELDDILR